jgi:hypothetical protein
MSREVGSMAESKNPVENQPPKGYVILSREEERAVRAAQSERIRNDPEYGL